MSPSPYGECLLVVNPTTITKALTSSSSVVSVSPPSPDSWPKIFLTTAVNKQDSARLGKDDLLKIPDPAELKMTEDQKTSSTDPECCRSNDKNNKLSDNAAKAPTLGRQQKEKHGADRRRCTSLDSDVVQTDDEAGAEKRVEQVSTTQQQQHRKSEELKSTSAKPTTGGKKPLLRPKDILMSSRQKSHILAHKSKTASTGAVPNDVLTHDLLVTVGAASTSTTASSCRDDKKVEDITKALDQLSMGAAEHMVLTSTDEHNGERIQRSPIPVTFEHHRRVNPYLAALQAQRFGRPIAPPPRQDSAWHWQQPQHELDGNGNRRRQVDDAFQDATCAGYVYGGTPPEYHGDSQQQQQQLSPCAYQQSPNRLVASTTVWPNHDAFAYHTNSVATVNASSSPDQCSGADNVQHQGSICGSTSSSGPLAPISELPDELSDYILQYSNKASSAVAVTDDRANLGAAADKENTTGEYGIDLNAAAAILCDNDGNSNAVGTVPTKAVSTCTATAGLKSPMPSSASPPLQAATTDALKSNSGKFDPSTSASTESVPSTTTTTCTGVVKTAKEQLRDMISNDDFNKAWIWALRCSQTFPGALYYRDVDGDSFLHIVVWHKDMAKIYSLTELMNRDDTHSFPKPFDLKNKQNETPLFLAVEKRLKEVVAYGVENSENPNTQTFNRDRDTPLHYAASRGMTEIVETLCHSPLIDLNMYNGAGLTPLLCAVKNHKNVLEDHQDLLNNKPVVRALLMSGADPKIIDSQTGKTIFHYAVECMDPLLIRIFRDHMDKETMQTLVNQPNLVGETPLRLLCRVVGARGFEADSPVVGEQLRAKMCQTLIESGAEWPRTTVGTGGADSPDFLLDDSGFTYFP